MAVPTVPMSTASDSSHLSALRMHTPLWSRLSAGSYRSNLLRTRGSFAVCAPLGAYGQRSEVKPPLAGPAPADRALDPHRAAGTHPHRHPAHVLPGLARELHRPLSALLDADRHRLDGAVCLATVRAHSEPPSGRSAHCRWRTTASAPCAPCSGKRPPRSRRRDPRGTSARPRSPTRHPAPSAARARVLRPDPRHVPSVSPSPHSQPLPPQKRLSIRTPNPGRTVAPSTPLDRT